MSEQPGFFERTSRWEYDNPIVMNVVMFGVILGTALLLGVSSWIYLVAIVAVGAIRIWGMRDGGYLRKGLQRKYGWD